MSIEPFKLSIPDAALEALSQRLSASVFPSQMESREGWELGTPVAEIQKLVRYWRSEFDWRKAEASLNELPQFKTSISVDGFGDIGIHCKRRTLDD